VSAWIWNGHIFINSKNAKLLFIIAIYDAIIYVFKLVNLTNAKLLFIIAIYDAIIYVFKLVNLTNWLSQDHNDPFLIYIVQSCNY